MQDLCGIFHSFQMDTLNQIGLELTHPHAPCRVGSTCVMNVSWTSCELIWEFTARKEDDRIKRPAIEHYMSYRSLPQSFVSLPYIGLWPGSIAHVAEIPRKNASPEFKLGNWSFFSCHPPSEQRRPTATYIGCTCSLARQFNTAIEQGWTQLWRCWS